MDAVSESTVPSQDGALTANANRFMNATCTSEKNMTLSPAATNPGLFLKGSGSRSNSLDARIAVAPCAMNKKIVQADSQTFQETIESAPLVFVDFYADWCGPCKMIAPSIDRLAAEYDGTVKFVKLNIDQSPEIARRYDVKSIPTLMIFRLGNPLRRMVGASPIGHYRGELQKVVSKNPDPDRQ